MISADGTLVAFQSFASNLVAGDTNGTMDVFVHTLAQLQFNGIPANPNPVSFIISNALGESGHLALVLLSTTGTWGFEIPDRRTVPLTFDAATIAGLGSYAVLSGTVDWNGVATTPTVQFPAAPPGIILYCAALTINEATQRCNSITLPIQVVTQ